MIPEYIDRDRLVAGLVFFKIKLTLKRRISA